MLVITDRPKHGQDRPADGAKRTPAFAQTLRKVSWRKHCYTYGAALCGRHFALGGPGTVMFDEMGAAKGQWRPAYAEL